MVGDSRRGRFASQLGGSRQFIREVRELQAEIVDGNMPELSLAGELPNSKRMGRSFGGS